MEPFPLPAGHVYGPPNGAIHWHSGRDNPFDGQWIRVWMDQYRQRINRGVRPDQIRPVFDGIVQAAVIDVQRLTGQPVTGTLGPDTWAAVWTYSPPQRPPVQQPPKAKKGGRGVSRTGQEYWRSMSTFHVKYGEDPAAPPWWPGRPFGPHERGEHVRQLQVLLGVKPTGVYNRDTERRVRGVQRIGGLPVSGVVDKSTALTVDYGPWGNDGEAGAGVSDRAVPIVAEPQVVHVAPDTPAFEPVP